MRAWWAVAALAAAACGTGVINGGTSGGPDLGGAGGSGSGGTGGTGGNGGSYTFADLPCEVANVLSSHCVSCHGSPLSGGANVQLLTHADLAATSPQYPGQTVAQRCVTRMQATTGAMPPTPPLVPAADVTAFATWLTNAMPTGSCVTAPPDAGPTCASTIHWTGANNGDPNMNPGLACLACHKGQNFNGQNPARDTAPAELWFYMGTVFPGVREADLCYGKPPAGVSIEILYVDGGVFTTLTPVGTSGNFMSNAAPPLHSNSPLVPAQYRARVKYQGRSTEMMTPQSNGDCNVCHTVTGEQGAPGRIVVP